MSQYLEDIGVTGQQVAPNTLTDLTVSIPTPPGWSPFSNPNITPQTGDLQGRQVSDGEAGGVQAARAISTPPKSSSTATTMPSWFENFKQLDASTADFNGFPSSMIQGSYDQDNMRMHS